MAEFRRASGIIPNETEPECCAQNTKAVSCGCDCQRPMNQLPVRWLSGKARIIAVALFAIVLTASVSSAQQSGSVRGFVHDAATARPLVGAIVILGPPGDERVTRTDESGAFLLAGIRAGEWSVTARRLGYESARRTISLPADTAPVTFALSRITTLDTVRVRAARQGIYGVVGTWTDMRPIPTATVHVLGSDVRQVTVDRTGHFFVALKAPGAYLLRAEARGHVPQTQSVTVPRNDGVEVAFLLDSATGPGARALAEAYDDLERRMLRRRASSVLISRSELLKHGHAQLQDAIRSSQSFNVKGLRLDDETCVFVDGRPRPGLTVDAIPPQNVEAVEIYTAASDASRTLLEAWPRAVPCSGAGFRPTGGFRDNVRWVVIWTRR